MAVRSTKADVIYKDMVRSFERAVNRFIELLNREVTRLTPRRTGRAARGWRVTNQYKIGRRSPSLVENRVPYIGLLDLGYSKQAPNGIVDPAMRRLTRRTERL
jgi:hypothetical protein